MDDSKLTAEKLEWDSEPTEEEMAWMQEHSNEISPRPRGELKEIATGVLGGSIFTSAQVHTNDAHMMTTIFLPVMFMEAPSDRVWAWYLKNWGLMLGKMEDALPRGVNGYPMFMKIQTLNKSDSEELYTIIKAMDEAMKSV